MQPLHSSDYMDWNYYRSRDKTDHPCQSVNKAAIIFFSVCERVEFNKSGNLIGSGG